MRARHRGLIVHVIGDVELAAAGALVGDAAGAAGEIAVDQAVLDTTCRPR